MRRHRLSPLFEPESVALFGATEREGAVGRFIYENLLASGYAGRIGLVNPKHRTLFGQPVAANAAKLPFAPELAIVAAPAHAVESIVAECAARGTRFVLVLSAGFAESGAAGRALQESLLATSRRLGVRLLGPNCLGLIRPSIGLNASFAVGKVKDGRVALVSQSGALVTAMIDWAIPAGIGFSSLVSLGSAIDLDFGELLDWFLFDDRTDSVLMYIEGVRDARSFMSSVRALARVKPVVIMKAGRTADTADRGGVARAIASHSGALTGNDRVFDAAIARAGAVRVGTSMQLLASARLLALKRRLPGRRLAIVTNGGGPGVLAADAANAQHLQIATLAPETLAALDRALPPHWSHGNPVDVIGDATRERLHAAIDATMRDPGVDCGLVLFVPQAITPSIDAAAAIIESAKATGKPLAAVLAGGATVAAGQRMLDEAGVPQFLTPENAVDAIALLDAFERNQRKLRQVPHAIDENCAPDVATANALYEAAAAEGRSMLDQIESKRLLRCFGIAAPPETVAATPDDAVRAADAIGYPVVLKILSPDITHKSDVGGVRINIQSAAGVRSAAEDILDSVARMRPQARIAGVVVQPMIRSRHQRELYVGASTDAVFGAVIAFGAGGVAVEQLDDVAIALPPLNANLARSLIERPRIHRVLRAYRNVPAIDFEGLEQALLRFSTLVCACPWIAAIDINPLLADESRVIALDARVEIKPPAEARQLRWRGAYGHLAIHPYPRELEQRASLRDGSPVLLRPIRPEDADAERRFVASLSRETLYRRFMMPVRELSDAMIERFTQIDYDRELAMVALRRDDDDAGGGERFVGVARIVPTWDDGVAEFAIVVADSLQRSGLGSLLMRQLFDAAKARGYREIVGMVLAENRSMLAFCERLGFTVHASPDDPAERVVRKPLD